MLQVICKEVFKEEKVLIYKQTEYFNDYKEYFKWQAISSHAFRRFAIERNVDEFGIETARTLSGHSDYATIIKHYSDYMNANDLKKKLLKK
jgi:integrase